MKSVRPLRSLSARIAFVAGVMVALLAALLVWNDRRTTEELLLTRAEQRISDIEVALDAALAPPMAHGDLEAAATALRGLHSRLGLPYLVLQDERQRTLAAVGRAVNEPLPPPSVSARDAVEREVGFDGALALRRGAAAVGFVRYGVSLAFVRQARGVMTGSALALTAAVILFSFWVTVLTTRSLRRRLAGLADALENLATNGRAARLPARGPGEVAELLRAANESTRRVEQRLAALAAQEARFQAVAECAHGVDAWFNPQGRLVWINRSIERVSGYTPLECVLAGNVVEMLVYQKDRKFALAEAKRALAGGLADNTEVRLQRKDGALVWVAVSWQVIQDADGKYLGLRVSLDDIQARKDAESRLLETVAELRRAQSLKEYYLVRANEERARLSALLDVMKVGVLFVNREQRVLFCNKALYRIWREPEHMDLTGLRDDTLLDRTTTLRADDETYRRHIAEVMQQTETSAPFEFKLTDGRTLLEISTLVPGPAPGEFIGRVWIHEDITEQKRIADRLIQLAERDPLTNLYNRRRFHEELERMLAEAARRGTELGLLVIDLDGFKPINDHYGHQAGDAVLVALAADVGNTVRRNEMFFRVGGDEFSILAPDSSEEEIIGLARRILSKITAMQFRFGDDDVRLTASVGIALYPHHGNTGKELVERGDQAMYRAKTSGKNRWHLWQGRNAA